MEESYLRLAVYAAILLPPAITYLLYRETDESVLFAGVGVAGIFLVHDVFGIPETYLRIAVLIAVLLPPAMTDLRGRYADDSVMFGGLGVACCFFAFDVLTGAFSSHSIMVQGGIILGIVFGVIMLAFALRGRMMGIPDAVIILTATMMVPALAGLPAGIIMILAGNIAAIIYFVADYAWKNVDDAVHRRPFAHNFGMHIKRAGERFTTRELHGRLGGMDGETVLDEKGGDFFEKAEARGMEVMTQMPMLTMYLLGVCAASFLVLVPEITPVQLFEFFLEFSGNRT